MASSYPWTKIRTREEKTAAMREAAVESDTSGDKQRAAQKIVAIVHDWARPPTIEEIMEVIDTKLESTGKELPKAGPEWKLLEQAAGYYHLEDPEAKGPILILQELTACFSDGGTDLDLVLRARGIRRVLVE